MSSVWRELAASPMMLFARRFEHTLDVTVKCAHDADPREHRRTAGRRDQAAGGSGGPVKRTAQPQRLIHPTADHASSRQLYSANAGGALVRFLSTYDQKETEHEITHLCGPRSIYNSGGRGFASCGPRLSLLPSRTNVGISRQLPVYELSAVLGFSVWHRCEMRSQSGGGFRTARTSTLSRTTTLLRPAGAGA